jgi:BirA family biotin operon repressor/biotin-[acetyl-CoA-carboxylase] ligase
MSLRAFRLPGREIHWFETTDSTMTEAARLAAAGRPSGTVAVAEETLPALTMALALATADAIARTVGQSCDLRWPNDVLLKGKKCAGVLAQIRDDAIVTGIGINVNHALFPEELRDAATSLRLVSGRVESRGRLLADLLDAIDRFCTKLVDEGKEAILQAFSRRSSFVKGRRVIVDRGGLLVRGVTEGLDPSGFLILRSDNGTRTLIVTGGVREEE